MTQRYKLIVEYDGTGLVGWQRQENGQSIQGFIEEAVFNFCQEKIHAYGSGRTDAGVHALGQVVHFDIEKDETPETVCKALNFHLKEHPVSILDVTKVDDTFHARFSAKERVYMYHIINRKAPLTLDAKRAWHIPYSLDTIAMQEAARYLVGKHDFSSFRAAECQAKSPEKTIDSITIATPQDSITIEVKALSFLHHMIRNIVGTLVEVGRGKWEPKKVKDVLEGKDRSHAGPTAPAHGLYFLKVEY